MIGRAGIAALIPHAGEMCLLERVTRWDRDSIQCVAISHRLETNPLRVDGVLGAACGVEYAAQAMALHGALVAGSDAPVRRGYLLSLRDLALEVESLQSVPGELCVTAVRLAAVEQQVSYQFRVESEGMTLLSGRALVLIAAEET